MTMSLNNWYLRKNGNLASWVKNQWTIQGSTDTCKWYLDNRVKTRRLKETQHKKGCTIQRAHSHIIIDVLLETKKAVLILVSRITTHVH